MEMDMVTASLGFSRFQSSWALCGSNSQHAYAVVIPAATHTCSYSHFNMAGITRNALALVNTIVDLMKTADVEEEKISLIRPKLSEIVEDFAGRLDSCEKLINDQKNLTTLLLQKIGGLEKKLKQSVTSDRRRQYNLVKNNIIVRSRKSIVDIQKFLCNSMELGGSAKITQKTIPVVEISPPPGQTRDSKVFRVGLSDGQKKYLFSGLAKASLGPEEMSNFKIDNEIPSYLIQTKRSLDRISYSLRKQFKESHHLRVKVVFGNLRLRCKVKDKNNPSWINLDDAKASDYYNTLVFFKPEEVPASGIPTVKDFYKQTLESLE